VPFDATATRSGNAGTSAAELEALLVEPLADAIGEASLVVVPTGSLHAVPWSGLRALRGRSVVVAPSLATWAALAGLPRTRRQQVVFIAGRGFATRRARCVSSAPAARCDRRAR
jgi:hypothetical protein